MPYRSTASIVRARCLFLVLVVLSLVLSACGTMSTASKQARTETIADPVATVNPAAVDVVIYALGLMDTGYRFGGKNPDAGLDCSGMVSYVYGQAANLRLAGSAADIAEQGRPIARDNLRPGDLVFFNTRNQSFSHVGIYIGDARFVHAPNSKGRVRIDRLDASYYAQRFEAARTYF